MIITSAKYVNDSHTNEVDHIDATIDGEVMSIPISTSNRHYNEIMRQVAEGTLTIADAE